MSPSTAVTILLTALVTGVPSYFIGINNSRRKEKERLLDDLIKDLEGLANDALKYFSSEPDQSEDLRLSINIRRGLNGLVKHKFRYMPAYTKKHCKSCFEDPLQNVFETTTGGAFESKSGIERAQADAVSEAFSEIIQHAKNQRADLNTMNILRRFGIDH